MGSEFREKGIDIQLGPVAGPLGRAPEGGRNWEGFSPDPVLTGIGMAETIRGIQDAGVVACAKHFILNEQEHFRQVGEALGYGYNITETLSSNVDDVTMHELYLWPFADAVRAGVGSVMCSYQQINNSLGCQNSYTLNYLLKHELDFQGFVLSDWQAQHSGVGSALAGLDMSMPGDVTFGTGTSYWGGNLTLAVLNGSVPEWRVDDMAIRIMAAWYKVGRDRTARPINFDSWTLDTFGNRHWLVGQGYELINEHVDVRDEHSLLIRNIAARATVLLKNSNNTLPLKKPRFIGVFGQGAAEIPYGENGCPDRGCDNGTLAQGWGSGTSNYPYLVTPLTAIQNQAVADGSVINAVTDNYAYSQIDFVARQASVCIVVVTADSGEGYISVDQNEGDRNNLTLWHDGETLIRNVTTSCNNTVVVIHSVGPVLVESFADNPNVTAIVWAGLPGQEAGNTLVSHPERWI
jgi:beta-glucosidase